MTGGLDGQVKVWDARTGLPILDLGGHRGLVGHILTVKVNGGEDTTLITAGVDEEIRAWDISSTPRLRWTQKEAHVSDVSLVYSDGKSLIRGGVDNKVRVWETQTGRMFRRLGDKFDAVYRVACKEGGGEAYIVISQQGLSLSLDMYI